MKLKIVLMTILIGYSGCSTMGNKILDEKISNESDIKSPANLQAEAKTSIDQAVNLSEDQKQKLTKLRLSVANQTNEFNKESLELRSVLMKDIIATNFNSKEVGLIKTRMRKLEDRRLTMIFDSVEKANIIMGRQAPSNQKVMGDFLVDRSFID